MDNYKNKKWLYQKYIVEKTDIHTLSSICDIDTEAIKEHLIKNDIPIGATLNIGNSDYIRRQTVKQRLQTSDEIINATKPTADAKILIFGAHGFVGTNLTKYLKEVTQYKVIAASRKDANAMYQHEIKELLLTHQPNVVINLAAFVGGIGLNQHNPADMIYKNLIMSANIVECCYQLAIRKLIFLGSVCSYPHTPKHIPFIEDDIWNGRPESTNEPYGVAKKTIGMMLGAYKKQYNFCSAYLIPTNMYGPGDDFSDTGSHVIPAMIAKFVDAKRYGGPVTLWGTGHASRDFLYVDDCCRAITATIQTIDDPSPINLGSGQETTIEKLANTIAKAVGYHGDIIWDTSKPDGQPRRCLDVSVARTRLGFTATTSLEAGIEETVNWYINQLQ